MEGGKEGFLRRFCRGEEGCPDEMFREKGNVGKHQNVVQVVAGVFRIPQAGRLLQAPCTTYRKHNHQEQLIQHQ